MIDFDDYVSEVLEDQQIRRSYLTADVQAELARTIREEMTKQGISIREMARKMESSVSVVQRLRGDVIGHTTTIRTVVTALDALGLELVLALKPKEEK